jgi:hypothetical protein
MSEDPLPLVDVEVGGRTVSVSLSGAMDRIDVDEAGGEVRVVVLDYKTGDTSGWRQKNLRGRAFQLPLYAALAPKLLASRFPGRRVRTVGAVYYDLGGSKVDLVEPLVDACDASDVMPGSRKRLLPDGQLAALVAGAVRRAGDVVAAVRRGVFHPTAIDGFKDGCAKCDFQSACRGAGEDARLSRMTDANLFPQVVALVDDGADSAREDDPEGEA